MKKADRKEDRNLSNDSGWSIIVAESQIVQPEIGLINEAIDAHLHDSFDQMVFAVGVFLQDFLKRTTLDHRKSLS